MRWKDTQSGSEFRTNKSSKQLSCWLYLHVHMCFLVYGMCSMRGIPDDGSK